MQIHPLHRRVLDEHDRRERSIVAAVDERRRNKVCDGSSARRLDAAGKRITCPTCQGTAYVARNGLVAAHFRP